MISDNIVFTDDIEAAVVIQVSGADLYDKWRYRFSAPGGAVLVDCYFQIVPPGAPGNASGAVALVTTCSPNGLISTGHTFPAGCPCSFGPLGGAFLISGTAVVGAQGTWSAVIDYTDPAGNITPGVIIDDIYLVRTPLVAVLHGFKSSCASGSMVALRSNLAFGLKISVDRVRCYDYDWAAGIQPGAQALGAWLRRFVAEVDPNQGEVDLVAHSEGGLVARYYTQLLRDPATRLDR
jgi:hypothetical protein